MSYQIVHLQDFELQLCKRASGTHSSPHRNGGHKKTSRVMCTALFFARRGILRSLELYKLLEVEYVMQWNFMCSLFFRYSQLLQHYLNKSALLLLKSDRLIFGVDLTCFRDSMYGLHVHWSIPYLIHDVYGVKAKVPKTADFLLPTGGGTFSKSPIHKRSSVYNRTTDITQYIHLVKHIFINSPTLSLQLSAHCESGTSSLAYDALFSLKSTLYTSQTKYRLHVELSTV
jgi:hypothetical protein